MIGIEAGALNEFIQTTWIMAERLEKFILPGRWRDFRLIGAIVKVAEFFQHILSCFDQFGALFNEFVTATSDRRMNGAGNGKDFPPLLGGEAGSNERAALRCRFNNEDAA